MMANTCAMWQPAAHTTDQLSSPNCLTRATQKSLTLNEKYLRVFWKMPGEWTISRKDYKTERARGLGRKKKEKRKEKKKKKEKKEEKKREEIGKGNQTTALRFQTGGTHQTSPASIRGLLPQNVRQINIKQTNMQVLSPNARHNRQFWTSAWV